MKNLPNPPTKGIHTYGEAVNFVKDVFDPNAVVSITFACIKEFEVAFLKEGRKAFILIDKVVVSLNDKTYYLPILPYTKECDMQSDLYKTILEAIKE